MRVLYLKREERGGRPEASPKTRRPPLSSFQMYCTRIEKQLTEYIERTRKVYEQGNTHRML